MFQFCMSELSGEQRAIREKEARVNETRARAEESARGLLLHIFQGDTLPDDRLAVVLSHVGAFFEEEPAKPLMSKNQQDELLSAIKAVTNTSDEKKFVEDVMNALKPFMELRVKHAIEFEDAEARDIMEKQGFTPVNERISYSIGGDQLQLHLAPAFEVKEKIEDYYRDALIKIADVVANNPEIKIIGGASWLNATKTYGAMKERLGFTISDISEEDRKKHHADATRSVKNAIMTREELLKRYYSASVKPKNT